MEESLKTVNLVHQVIIAVCAAIIAFSLTPNPTAEYQAALDQISVLRRFPFTDFDEYAHQLVSAKDQQIAQKYRNTLGHLSGVKLSKDFAVNQPIYVERPRDDATIPEILEFFAGENRIAYPELDESGLTAAAVEHAISEKNRCAIPADSELSLLAIDMPQPVEPTTFAPWSAPKATASNVSLIFSKRISPFENTACQRFMTINSFPSVLPGNHAMNWITVRNRGKVPDLGRLRAVSSQLAHMNYAAASKFLEDKINSPTPPLKFLGLELDEERAVRLGPLTTLFLLLFFLCYLHHVRVAKLDGNNGFESFPWIGLFPDLLSKLLTLASVAILPAYSNVLLVARSAHWRTPGWIVVTGVALVGFAIAREIRQLRLCANFRRPKHFVASGFE